MNSVFLKTITDLTSSGATFVTATVVSRRAPVSSHLSDRAIVHSDGRMEGFVGGSCSREIVRRQALEVMRVGKPRLVMIRPDISEVAAQQAADSESVVVPMTCASEGAADVYLEPHVPARMLLVAGFTPVAQAVAQIGALLELHVVRVVTTEELRDLEASGATLVALSDLSAWLFNLSETQRSSLSAVVASQGHYDEPVLEPLLLAGVGFVGLLASRKRAATVRELLELQGVSADLTAQIRNPVGLDIDAKTPAEVAVSIVAEIIAARGNAKPMFTDSSQYDATAHRSSVTETVGARHASPAQTVKTVSSIPSLSSIGLPSPRAGFAFSPVDGEEIEIATAVHFTELNGQTYYFTCANCKRRFLKNPASFLLEPVTAGQPA